VPDLKDKIVVVSKKLDNRFKNNYELRGEALL